MNIDKLNFSDEQKAVLNLCEGKHLVLAPPGSGKTRVLAHRVLSAIQSGINPEKMICLTFTNRASQSMLNRISSHVSGDTLSKVMIGNIHHFCFSFLMKNHLIPGLSSLLDEEDAGDLLLDIILRMGGDNPKEITHVIDYAAYVYRKKKNFPECLNQRPQRNIQINLNLEDVCDAYILEKEAQLLLDYDDLLTLTYCFLRDQEVDVNFSWIQVDEVQDLNSLQWAIIELLSSGDAHSVYFGDYDQSIYSFMGASVSKEDCLHKACTVHRFQVNYRSKSFILDVLNEYAARNFGKPSSHLAVSAVTSAAPTNALTIGSITGRENKEIDFLTERLLPKLTNDKSLQTAVLVRWNETADRISVGLVRAGINHIKVSKFDLFRRKSVKDIIAFLSILSAPTARSPYFRLFSLFGSITLRSSRALVHEMFSCGLFPADIFPTLSISNNNLFDFHNLFSRSRLVVFDTETTGLDTASDDIIQIAAVEIINGKKGNAFEVFLSTDKDLTKTQSIHKISADFLSHNAVDPKQGLASFLEFLDGDILVAHNLVYDYKILLSNLQRNNLPTVSLQQVKKFDTLEISKRRFNNLHSYKLSYLIEHFELPGINSHNAMDDVLATVNLALFLNNSVSALVPLQTTVLNKYAAVIDKVKTALSPLLSEIYALNSNTSIRRLVSLFLKYPFPPSVKLIFDTDVAYIERFLNFTDAYCGIQHLETLKRIYIPLYSKFREPDLITKDDRLVISTIHKAKGLEFDAIVIAHCNNLLFPAPRSRKNPVLLEEEKRLLFVALSRARSQLHITFFNGKDNGNIYASPFLNPVTKSFNCYKI